MDEEERRLAAASCEWLMSRLDTFLREHKLTTKVIDWASLGFPVIDRGTHAIYPLMVAARTPDGDSGGEADLTSVVEMVWRHWAYVYGGHEERVGRFRDNDEWGKQALGEKLHAYSDEGRSPVWWHIGHHVVVFVTSTDRGRTVVRSALHVVPREWVLTGQTTPSTKAALSRCRRMVRRVGEADLDWSWEQSLSDPSQMWVTAADESPGPGEAQDSRPVRMSSSSRRW